MENNDTDTLVTKYIAAFGEISFKGKKGTTEEALELAYTDLSPKSMRT